MRARAMETRAMKRQAQRRRWMGAAVVVAELTAGAAWAAPAPVRVEVTSEALDPKHAKTVGPRVRDAAEDSLRDEHDVPVEGDATTIVAVELRPITKASERDKVIFRVTVLVDGKEVYAGQPTSCWGCDESKLLASVRTQVGGVVEHLPERAEEEVVVEEPTAAGDEAGGDGVEGEDRSAVDQPVDGEVSTPAPTLTVRNVGIGLTAAGGVALAVGIGLVVAKERALDVDEERELVQQLRPTGVALAVIGGAALAAGVVALVVHGTRKKQAKRTAWAPVGGAGFVGFAIERRF